MYSRGIILKYSNLLWLIILYFKFTELPSKEISPTVNDVLEQGHMSIINIAGLIEGGNEVKVSPNKPIMAILKFF